MSVLDSNEILSYVLSKVELGIDAIEATMMFTKEYDIEPEIVGVMCSENPRLYAILEREAEHQNLIVKGSRLEFDE